MKGGAPLETPSGSARLIVSSSAHTSQNLRLRANAEPLTANRLCPFSSVFWGPLPQNTAKKQAVCLEAESAMPTLLTHATHAERRLANLFRTTRWSWAGWAKPRGIVFS